MFIKSFDLRRKLSTSWVIQEGKCATYSWIGSRVSEIRSESYCSASGKLDPCILDIYPQCYWNDFSAPIPKKNTYCTLPPNCRQIINFYVY